MEQKNKLKLNSGGLLVFILTVGVFGIINTEMGVVGILPLIAETFNVSVHDRWVENARTSRSGRKEVRP